MPFGYLAIVLHAHLPYIHHPEHEEFLEEDWLFEAITETYLPLIQTWHNLAAEHTPFRLTMSVTPPVISMLCDKLLQRRYVRYLERRLTLVEHELRRTRKMPNLHETALVYRRRFHQAHALFCERYNRNLLNAFREFQDRGELEILACPATHGFLPLMLTPNAVRAQVSIGCEMAEHAFGKRPKGIWLPECAYIPGLERVLAAEGIRYFIVDTHGLTHGRPAAKAGPYAPIKCPNGVAVFARDPESSKQVWSKEEGYPGDGVYREFYRDLGYDGDYEHIRPFLHPDGIRRNLGIKYHRITGPVPLHEKQPYDPRAAFLKAEEHAGHFVWAREKQCEWLSANVTPHPIVVAPYDAELYGHWWFEGPHFLEHVFRKLSFMRDKVQPVSLSEYLEAHPPQQIVRPSASSWGDKGYFEVWLNGKNDWIYPHLHKAEERMVELATHFSSPAHSPEPGSLLERALNQAARELLLAQSSDWAFLMTVGTAEPYAQKRTRNHLWRFIRLYEEIKSDRIDPLYLETYEQLDNIFPNIDFRVYA